MSFVQLVVVVAGVLALCVVAMAVGVIFRNKTFTSCGCASVTYRGERIRCPACPEKEEDESGDGDAGAPKTEVEKSASTAVS